MNSDVMVHTNSVKTDMKKDGLITDLKFSADSKTYRVKRIRGVYRISTENGVLDTVINEDYFRDVDLAMRSYEKIKSLKKTVTEGRRN